MLHVAGTETLVRGGGQYIGSTAIPRCPFFGRHGEHWSDASAEQEKLGATRLVTG